jgi:hypothetical protein
MPKVAVHPQLLLRSVVQVRVIELRKEKPPPGHGPGGGGKVGVDGIGQLRNSLLRNVAPTSRSTPVRAVPNQLWLSTSTENPVCLRRSVGRQKAFVPSSRGNEPGYKTPRELP